ncbi:MAG TPA: hypothetical protein VLX92_05310 [Kofleriaceae bacterium]|nr:hypothetical protein [Kofleriaceae bacterium]
MRCSLAFVALAALAGCGKTTCARNSDCAPSQACSALGVCEIAPDASPSSSPADAGPSDAPADAADAADAAIDGGP